MQLGILDTLVLVALAIWLFVMLSGPITKWLKKQAEKLKRQPELSAEQIRQISQNPETADSLELLTQIVLLRDRAAQFECAETEKKLLSAANTYLKEMQL